MNIANALLDTGLLTEEQLRHANETCSRRNASSAVPILMELDYLSFRGFQTFVQSKMGIRSSVLGDRELEPELCKKLGLKNMASFYMIPLVAKVTGGKPSVAVAFVDPLDTKALKTAATEFKAQIIPILVSLPDFKQAMERVRRLLLEIRTAPTEEKLEVMRPGEYDAEMGHRALREGTKSGATKTGINPREVTGQHMEILKNSHDPQLRFIGTQGQVTLKQVVQRLGLAEADRKMLKKENYTRDLLFNELQEISPGALETAFHSLSMDLKLECLANALLKAGVLTRRDIQESAGVTLAFAEEKDL